MVCSYRARLPRIWPLHRLAPGNLLDSSFYSSGEFTQIRGAERLNTIKNITNHFAQGNFSWSAFLIREPTEERIVVSANTFCDPCYVGERQQLSCRCRVIVVGTRSLRRHVDQLPKPRPRAWSAPAGEGDASASVKQTRWWSRLKCVLMLREYRRARHETASVCPKRTHRNSNACAQRLCCQRWEENSFWIVK